jgi:hypothetical protein
MDWEQKFLGKFDQQLIDKMFEGCRPFLPDSVGALLTNPKKNHFDEFVLIDHFDS